MKMCVFCEVTWEPAWSITWPGSKNSPSACVQSNTTKFQIFGVACEISPTKSKEKFNPVSLVLEFSCSEFQICLVCGSKGGDQR